MELTIKNGRRQSTYITYVEPIIKTKKKLRLIKYADVTEIIFSSNLKYKHRAVGVKFNRHGTTFEAYASKEVILSAGAIGTPMLLFKSGIGPAKMLRKAKVTIYFGY